MVGNRSTMETEQRQPPEQQSRQPRKICQHDEQAEKKSRYDEAIPRKDRRTT